MRVYAINLLNYYKEKLAPFDEQLALEGIEPQYLEELNLASSQNQQRSAFERFVKTVELKVVQERERGLFVVDFTGNGLSSRAVIRKGALTCTVECTLAGHLLTLLDESGALCGNEDQ